MMRKKQDQSLGFKCDLLPSGALYENVGKAHFFLFPSAHVTWAMSQTVPQQSLSIINAMYPLPTIAILVLHKRNEKALRPSFQSFQVLGTSSIWFQSFQFLKTSPTWFSIFWRWTPPRDAFQPFTFCTFTKTLKIFFFDDFDDKRDISKDTSCIKFLSFCCLSLVSLGPKTNMSKD